MEEIIPQNYLERSKKSLRILTYNLFLVPGILPDCMGGSYKEQRIDDLAKNHFKDYDIICFQEVYSILNSRIRKIINLGKEYGFDHSSISPIPTFENNPNQKLITVFCTRDLSYMPRPIGNGGLVTISRYPIKESQFHGFDHADGICKIAWKGILYTQIEIDDMTKQTLHLFNTHLQAQYVYLKKDEKISHKHLERAKYSLQARITQTCDIRDFIERIYKEKSILKNDNKNIVALCGDLNVDAKGDEILSEHIIKFHPDFVKYREGLQKNKNGPMSFSEYDYIMDIFSGGGADKIINLSLESHGEHQVTMGEIVYDKNGNKMPAETFLTNKNSQMREMSLDYCLIFQKDKGKDPRDYNEALEKTIKSCKVNQFKIEGKKYSQLSDHYGLEYCLEMPKI